MPGEAGYIQPTNSWIISGRLPLVRLPSQIQLLGRTHIVETPHRQGIRRTFHFLGIGFGFALNLNEPTTKP